MKNALRFLKKVNVIWLMLIPWLIGFGLFTLWNRLQPQHEVGALLGKPYLIIGSISFFIVGFAGIAQIWRKEMPGPIGKPIRGTIAVLSGILLVILFWGGALLLLILALLRQ